MADYIRSSSSIALLVVRASELAPARSSATPIRRLAERLRREHLGIASQLSFAGRRLNLLPSATLLPVDQAMLAGLARASDFDTAFARTMRSAVERCRVEHYAYARDGASPTLRPVARFAASACAAEQPAIPPS